MYNTVQGTIHTQTHIYKNIKYMCIRRINGTRED